jgi:hypothetical protein
MRVVKSSSSKWLNAEFPNVKFGWQCGYAAFTVSQSALPEVIDYVRRQDAHHRRKSFGEEIALFLERHGFEAE